MYIDKDRKGHKIGAAAQHHWQINTVAGRVV